MSSVGSGPILVFHSVAGWSSSVARRAHNPKVAGSNPAPATNQKARKQCVSGLSAFSGRRRIGPPCTKYVPRRRESAPGDAGRRPDVATHREWWSGVVTACRAVRALGCRFPVLGGSVPVLGHERTTTEQLIDIAGLAERLGVGERFVRRLVNERRIPFLKIGRHVRFDLDDVEAWISDSRVEPSQPFVARALAIVAVVAVAVGEVG